MIAALLRFLLGPERTLTKREEWRANYSRRFFPPLRNKDDEREVQRQRTVRRVA